MDSNLLTLSKIFTERLFRIPDYQRGYAWTERQLLDFWNDLSQIEDEKNHYTGVLTLEEVPNEIQSEWEDDLWIIKHKSFHPLYIVDGQQRLTTAIILIQSVVEVAEKNNIETLNYTSLIDIRRKFIFDTKDKGISRSYIFGYEKDNPSYEYLKTEIFNEKSDTSYHKQETIYTQNLVNSKIFFLDKLNGFNQEKLEEVYKKLTQHLLFNIYTISDDIDTFVSFETMNNRGKPLSHLELLKNRLIYLSTLLSDDDHEKKSLRKRINECWKSIYHNLGKNKENPLDDDKFLVNHFVVYFGNDIWDWDNEESRLRVPYFLRMHERSHSNYLLEEVFTTKKIKNNDLTIDSLDNYVSSLRDSVELWYQIHNPLDSTKSKEVGEWLYKINRLGELGINIHGCSALIMNFLKVEKNIEVRISFLIELERLLFITSLISISDYILDSEGVNFLKLAYKLHHKKIKVEYVIKKISEQTNNIMTNDNIKNFLIKDFSERGFYHWKGIRYFLYEYDLSLYQESKTQRKKLNWEDFNKRDYESIEHIYPQGARAKCWTDIFSRFSSKHKKILRNSLGNLLPLSRAKNSSLGNKCFQEKISNERNKSGYRYGCYAENAVTEYNQWTEKEILERGLELLDFMEERWNIKVGNRSNKVNLLGLQFLEPKESKEPKRQVAKRRKGQVNNKTEDKAVD